MVDLSSAATNVVTGGVGAYIALVAKDYFERGAQARAADIEEYKKVRATLTDSMIVTLQSADFLAGMVLTRFRDPLRDLLYAYEGGRQLIFHDKRLNDRFHVLLKATNELLDRCAELTVPEGEPPRLSTRTRADRLYGNDETLRQNAAEAAILDGQSHALAEVCKKFVDDAKRRLRT
ncbi:hypothetical protein [Caballeronia zhejiangensis]|uniref:hypothetical protein n=1 Tax=Caballeronia zhejiangensis TaxID=871203 RepID=UPI001FD4CBF1|nr:hypothetical protein [Caballeronia zhejiangensis]